MNNHTSRPRYAIRGKRFPIELWRLSDTENDEFEARSIRINIDSMIIMRLDLSDRGNPGRLTLAKLFVTLKTLFGPTARLLDERKQTFTFPCLLHIHKDGRDLPYRLQIQDYRGDPDFRLSRIINHERFFNLDQRYSHPPIDDELNTEDIEYLICLIWNNLTIIGSDICAKKVANQTLQPFVHHVDSSHVIYGFADGDFFEHEIDDYDEYHSTVNALRTKHCPPEPTPTQSLQTTQAMIQTVINSNPQTNGEQYD
jgi:hypothetical protein